MKKKILIINTAGMGLGGITTHILTYLEAIIGDCPSLSVTIGVTGLRDDDVILRFQKLGCKIIDLPNRKKNVFLYMKEINKLMHKHQFDVLHVHGNSGTMVIELFCGLLNHIPIRIAHCHNSVSNHMLVHKILGSLFTKTYTNAFACSDLAGEWLFGKDGYVVLPNAIDLSKFHFSRAIRAKKRAELGIPASKRVIGHVGNFNQQKNHVFLVNIFKEILKHEDSLLLLVGTGALEPVIKEKVRDEGLSDKVIFLGLRDDVYDWMQAMDCFIFPSKWEGFGTVLIEAQASGLPVLSADTAPDSVKINSNFIFMSLDSSPCQWAQQACNLLESNKNVRCIDVKKFSNYDVSYTKKIVEEVYHIQGR